MTSPAKKRRPGKADRKRPATPDLPPPRDGEVKGGYIGETEKNLRRPGRS